MKKVLLILVAMVAMMSAQTISAKVLTGDCGDNATYTFDNESGLLTISGTGAMWTFAEWKDHGDGKAPWQVSYENEDWYVEYGEWLITDVVVEEGIVEIHNLNGSGTNYLETVTLPKSLRVIGDYCFSYVSFEEINIPYGVTTIGESAFYKGGLLTVYIPSTVTEIGEDAFTMNPLENIYVNWDKASAIVDLSEVGNVFANDVNNNLKIPHI